MEQSIVHSLCRQLKSEESCFFPKKTFVSTMSVCGLWAKNFRKFGEVFWTFVKCIFHVTRWRMRVKTIVLKKVIQISSLAEFEPEKIGLSGLKIWQGFKTALQVQRKQFWGKKHSLENSYFEITPQVWTKTFWCSRHKMFDRVVKSAFYISRGTFEKWFLQ